MNIILTSGPKFYIKKANGEKKSIKLENTELIETLKKSISRYNNLLFICSEPDDYKTNELYAEIIQKSLSLSGFKFDYCDLLDSRNWLFTKSLVKNSDLVILLGGNTITQMEFFNNIELKNKIKGFNGCLMGISAGSINMACNAYCSKDDDVSESVYYKGLGLTNIRIEPHFDIDDKERINDILLTDSNKKSFLALPNESFIHIFDNKIELHGDGYYFNNGSFQKVSKDISSIAQVK